MGRNKVGEDVGKNERALFRIARRKKCACPSEIGSKCSRTSGKINVKQSQVFVSRTVGTRTHAPALV